MLSGLREMRIEEKGLMLIPGYYDLWKATEEVEQALPQLKCLFGKQLSDTFFDELLLRSNLNKIIVKRGKMNGHRIYNKNFINGSNCLICYRNIFLSGFYKK